MWNWPSLYCLLSFVWIFRPCRNTFRSNTRSFSVPPPNRGYTKSSSYGRLSSAYCTQTADRRPSPFLQYVPCSKLKTILRLLEVWLPVWALIFRLQLWLLFWCGAISKDGYVHKQNSLWLRSSRKDCAPWTFFYMTGLTAQACRAGTLVVIWLDIAVGCSTITLSESLYCFFFLW